MVSKVVLCLALACVFAIYTGSVNATINCYHCESTWYGSCGWYFNEAATGKIPCSSNRCWKVSVRNMQGDWRMIRGCAERLGVCGIIRDCEECTSDSCNSGLFE